MKRQIIVHVASFRMTIDIEKDSLSDSSIIQLARNKLREVGGEVESYEFEEEI